MSHNPGTDRSSGKMDPLVQGHSADSGAGNRGAGAGTGAMPATNGKSYRRIPQYTYRGPAGGRFGGYGGGGRLSYEQQQQREYEHQDMINKRQRQQQQRDEMHAEIKAVSTVMFVCEC